MPGFASADYFNNRQNATKDSVYVFPLEAIQIYEAITYQNTVPYGRLFLPVVGTMIHLHYIPMT
jgi:hypothetical protein